MSDKHHPSYESLCVSVSIRYSNSKDCVYTINTADPQTSILGGSDIFTEEGDTINITCLVKDSPEPPQFISWHHGEQVLVTQ